MSDSVQNLVSSLPWTRCLQDLIGLRPPYFHNTGTESKELCRENLHAFWMTITWSEIFFTLFLLYISYYHSSPHTLFHLHPEIFSNSFLIFEIWSIWVRTTMRSMWEEHRKTHFTGSKKDPERYWVIYVTL